MTTNEKLDVDKVIDSAEEGETEPQRDGLLMNDNEDYMALLTLCKQLREERRWQRLDISTPELEKVKQSGQDVLIYIEKTNEMFVAYYRGKSWNFAVGEFGGRFCLKDPTHWMALPEVLDDN